MTEFNPFLCSYFIQGAKAQMKRERNAKDAKKGPTSQLKAVKYLFLEC